MKPYRGGHAGLLIKPINQKTSFFISLFQIYKRVNWQEATCCSTLVIQKPAGTVNQTMR